MTLFVIFSSLKYRICVYEARISSWEYQCLRKLCFLLIVCRWFSVQIWKASIMLQEKKIPNKAPKLWDILYHVFSIFLAKDPVYFALETGNFASQPDLDRKVDCTFVFLIWRSRNLEIWRTNYVNSHVMSASYVTIVRIIHVNCQVSKMHDVAALLLKWRKADDFFVDLREKNFNPRDQLIGKMLPWRGLLLPVIA